MTDDEPAVATEVRCPECDVAGGFPHSNSVHTVTCAECEGHGVSFKQAVDVLSATLAEVRKLNASMEALCADIRAMMDRIDERH